MRQFLMGFDELLLNFGNLRKHFGTVTQCSVDPTMPVLLTAKPLHTVILEYFNIKE